MLAEKNTNKVLGYFKKIFGAALCCAKWTLCRIQRISINSPSRKSVSDKSVQK